MVQVKMTVNCQAASGERGRPDIYWFNFLPRNLHSDGVRMSGLRQPRNAAHVSCSVEQATLSKACTMLAPRPKAPRF